MAEIARQLGVCTSAIAKAIRKKEGEDQINLNVKMVSGNGNKVLKKSLDVRTDMRKFKGPDKKKIPWL